MNKTSIVNKFLEYELSTVHPKIIEWQGYKITEKNLKTKIENFVAKASKDENKTFQLLELENLNILLIRLDETKNSVDVYFSNFSLIENQEYLIKQIKHSFPKLIVENIYFTDSRTVYLSHLEVSHYTYAGKIELIKKSNKNDKYEVIKLTEAKDITFYPEYLKMYDEFYEDYPKLKAIIGDPESVESIKYLIENGIVKLLYINNEISGVILGIKMDYDEMSGYFVCDKILNRKYRGKGFGVAMERKFIESLKVCENELVFGTINSENTASFRTSTSIGRICTRVHYKIKC